MTERWIRHDSFVIERDYAAPVSQVFAAWADRAAAVPRSEQ
jgi:uncharacterized protein YndB with AHSA1/START domain